MEQSLRQQPPVGALRFNTDSSKMEYYDGNQWVNITSDSPEVQTGGTRGLFMGGYGGPAPNLNKNDINYINMATTGNALDFGNLTATVRSNNCFASRTRGVSFGGQTPGFVDTIDYVTISSLGDAVDFGNISDGAGWATGCSDQTRGVMGAMYHSSGGSVYTNVLEYVTIAVTSDTIDFGDLTHARLGRGASISSPTRGVWGGGDDPSGDTNIIDFITIATLGNAADFGDLVNARNSLGACSNAVRGLFAGGYDWAAPVSTNNNNIEYITIASLGNTLDFGDLSVAVAGTSGMASPTRGCFGGMWVHPAGITNVIDYVELMTTGNTIDFGDLVVALFGGTCSNGHGGLG